MKKTITIVLGMIVIATAINYCDPGGFDKNNKVAMQVALSLMRNHSVAR